MDKKDLYLTLYKQVHRNHRMFTTTNKTDDKGRHTPTYTISHM